MIATSHCIVGGLEESGVVMGSIGLVTARYRTVQATPEFSMMTHETVEIRHGWSIRSVEPEKQSALKESISSCIPDGQTLLLEGNKMVETWINERI